ncbi:DUF4181 domain-containing protein [Saliterribacillus persicus]|uniref:DUF4181 domain-containing protein n=1 Tax=Saliterribacillus persicus TaxID=930114 RepID=UPI003CCC5FC2
MIILIFLVSITILLRVSIRKLLKIKKTDRNEYPRRLSEWTYFGIVTIIILFYVVLSFIESQLYRSMTIYISIGILFLFISIMQWIFIKEKREHLLSLLTGIVLIGLAILTTYIIIPAFF